MFVTDGFLKEKRTFVFDDDSIFDLVSGCITSSRFLLELQYPFTFRSVDTFTFTL